MTVLSEAAPPRRSPRRSAGAAVVDGRGRRAGGQPPWPRRRCRRSTARPSTASPPTSASPPGWPPGPPRRRPRGPRARSPRPAPSAPRPPPQRARGRRRRGGRCGAGLLGVPGLRPVGRLRARPRDQPRRLRDPASPRALNSSYARLPPPSHEQSESRSADRRVPTPRSSAARRCCSSSRRSPTSDVTVRVRARDRRDRARAVQRPAARGHGGRGGRR